MRVALGIEYNGAAYHGWQAQDGGVRTVQQTVEEAVSFVANHPVRLVCAGRTDTGVHATNQVVHFDTEVERESKAWVFGCNTQLPEDVSVRWATPVDPAFHARFSAVSRRYRYVIYNHPVRPALFNRQLTWNYRPLDVELMTKGASCLLGEHDFSALRAIGCQSKSPVRTILALDIVRQGDLVIIDIQANAFLQHMVRNIAGVLMPVGAGLRPVEWVSEVLEGKKRADGGVTAPPYGLYFVGVGYPEEFQLPKVDPGPSWLT